MRESFIKHLPLPGFSLWGKMKNKRKMLSFELEITGRCNNNCRHCYINLSADDEKAKAKELNLNQIQKISDEAVSLGAVWCLITGGEPLLRKDFFDIYLSLKKKGLLVSVFTNATLITLEHIRLFKEYPPRDIEVTVYGITRETYERVSRKRGSFLAFRRGLNLLLDNGIKVRFKAMALRSNIHQLPEISSFCRKITKDYFRFDPFLHLRFDGNSKRNEEIKAERLLPQEIAEIERKDSERFQALENNCQRLIQPALSDLNCNHLFHCATGRGSVAISYDGFLKPCSSLWHPDCIFDVKNKSLIEAWLDFIPRVRDMRSNRQEFLKRCHSCSIINLCLWCPAHAYLETGELDKPVDYFCEVAHARAASLGTAHDKKSQESNGIQISKH